MASLASGLRHVPRCPRQLSSTAGWHKQLAIRARPSDARRLSTSPESGSPSDAAPAEGMQIPFRGIEHARQVPVLRSYFSREPTFNQLHLRLFRLLAQYHDLPTLEARDAPVRPWHRVDGVRQHMGEPIKAAHFSRVMRIAKRLNLIEPSMRPVEVDEALKSLSRPVETSVSFRKPTTVDKHGRAVGVGGRKESTARAFVVEGTGEVLVNGKTLSEAFGRVHDRESAIWALTATDRLDKYNVWVIVRGGGTTGQAEATAMAIANGLIAHEPALKPSLRAAGTITRDPRKVERKKHGHVKARKSPAWVKR